MDLGAIKIELGELVEIPRHTHEGIELFFLLKGNVQMHLDGHEYKMLPNDIILCNNTQVHGAKGGEHNIIFRLNIGEDFLLRETNESYIWLQCNSCAADAHSYPTEYEQLRRLLAKLMISYFERAEMRPLEVKSILLQLLSLLYENFADTSRAQDKHTYDNRIQSTVLYIKKHYREDISLNSIAEQEHLSVHYMSRLFRRETGYSFTEYLNNTRLAGAVNDLLHSDESIIRIALNNGFSNVASFNRLFNQVYNDTPAKYRAARKVGAGAHSSELKESFKPSSELIKDLRQYDTKHHGSKGKKLVCSFDAAKKDIRDRVRLPEKIVRIGQISQLLKYDTHMQLEQLIVNRKINFVHFSCIFDDGMYKFSNALYLNFEYMRALDFLKANSLAPFIQLRIHSALEAGTEGITLANDRLANFLEAICERYNEGFLNKWRFEISYPPNCGCELLQQCYCEFAHTIHYFFPRADICLQFQYGKVNFEAQAAGLADFLSKCLHHGSTPSYITFYISDSEQNRLWTENENFYRYRHIASSQISRLHNYLKESGLKPPGMLLMKWNTLSGYTTAQSNSFYRSALFLDEILNLKSYTTGIAYWLNTYIHEASTGKDSFDAVALYIFNNLRRPIYFTDMLMDYLYNQVLLREDNLLVTRNHNGDIAMLAMNPCYFDPQLSSDASYTDGEQRLLSINIENINGTKVIERYHIDNRQTSLYDRWAHMGFPSIINERVMDQLSRTTNVDYATYEENLTGSYTISLPLAFNEAAVIMITNKSKIPTSQL